MTSVNVYLTFNGNCEEVFNFSNQFSEANFLTSADSKTCLQQMVNQSKVPTVKKSCT